MHKYTWTEKARYKQKSVRENFGRASIGNKRFYN